MLAVWYPIEWLQRAGVGWNLSFMVLVTVFFALAVGYLLIHRKKP